MAESWRHKAGQLLRFGGAFALTQLIAYGFIVLAGRWLAPHDFGRLNALLGMLMLGGVFANALQAAATQAITRAPALAQGRPLLRWTLQLGVLPTLVFAAGMLILGSRIGVGPGESALCLLVFLAMTLGAAPAGAMHALGQVRLQTEMGLLGALLRLALGALALRWLDRHVAACLAAYVANYVFLGAAAYRWLRAHRRPETGGETGATGASKLALQPATLLSMLFGMAPFTLDQVLVSSFAPAAGGVFAALSTAGKVVFFAALPVTTWAYPALLHARGRAPWLRVLAAAALGMLLLPGTAAALLAAFPQFVLSQMFGAGLAQSASALPLLALGVLCFSLSSLLIQVSIAAGRQAVWPSVLALALGWVLYALRHDSLAAVVENQAAMYAAQLLLLALHLAWLARLGKSGR